MVILLYLVLLRKQGQQPRKTKKELRHTREQTGTQRKGCREGIKTANKGLFGSMAESKTNSPSARTVGRNVANEEGVGGKKGGVGVRFE